MVIKLTDYISNGINNSEGELIFKIIMDKIEKEENLEISFSGMTAVSSSFVNSAFIELLKFYKFEYIKNKIKFKDTLKVHNDLIKSRFEFETAHRITAP